MIINFTISNWLSFKEKTHFTMMASNLNRFDNRLSEFGNFKFRLLPVSGIYGGNATGKSNLIHALSFLRKFVTEGTANKTARIPVVPFLLDTKSRNSHTKFEIDILIDNTIYEYSFTVNQTGVKREKLTTTDETGEQLQFTRVGKEIKLKGLFNERKKKDWEYYNFIAKSTRTNQLFLTSLGLQEAEILQPLIDWFENLIVVRPQSAINSTYNFMEEHPFSQIFNEVIYKLDFGISSIGTKRISFDHDLHLPDEIKEDILKNVREDSASILEDSLGQRRKITQKDGEVITEELIANHFTTDGEDFKFNFSMESEGTRRVMDLLPAFFLLANKNYVVVVDEIERSLHPILVRQLVESYFENRERKNLKSQLLFTTHCVDLMDNKFLRPDEIWLTEKAMSGESTLSSLSDYKEAMGEEDFQTAYLEGRFGGVPQIQLGGILNDSGRKTRTNRKKRKIGENSAPQLHSQV